MKLDAKVCVRQWMMAVAVCALSACGVQSESSELQSSANDEIVEQPFYEVNKPSDPQLNSGHTLYRYFQAAQAKKLPANFFREIIAANGSISVRYGDWPRFQPSGAGGTISHPAVGKAFTEWKNGDWSSFYNELFHAWWASVFTRASSYATIRSQLLTSERRSHYARAHPSNPLLAQEEAYSETIMSLMTYMYPSYHPNLPNNTGYRTLDLFPYDTGKTVSPVSHSESPGYTPEAENIYPNQFEYSVIFKIMTDHEPPPAS